MLFAIRRERVVMGCLKNCLTGGSDLMIIGNELKANEREPCSAPK